MVSLMSEQGDGAELAKLVTSLSRHLQRRQRIGVRFVPQDDLPETGSVMANNENLLSGTAGDLFSDSAAAFKPKASRSCARPSATAVGANSGPAERTWSSAWAIATQS